jgi:hypothetical protein
MDRQGRATAEARAVLERVARRRSAITYSELVDKIHAIHLEPDSKLLAQILDEISTKSHGERDCMLSAVVIHKDSDDLPGPGFFSLAEALGRNPSDKVAFHAAEIHRVHKSFGL